MAFMTWIIQAQLNVSLFKSQLDNFLGDDKWQSEHVDKFNITTGDGEWFQDREFVKEFFSDSLNGVLESIRQVIDRQI